MVEVCPMADMQVAHLQPLCRATITIAVKDIALRSGKKEKGFTALAVLKIHAQNLKRKNWN
jgi:hypothetical protein